MADVAAPPAKPEPDSYESLVPRPALIGRGEPFPPRTQVVAVQFGTFLALHSERLQVRKDGKVVDEVPLFRMSELVVGARGVALSCDLIRELCERGIRTVFLESTGTPYAMLSSPMLTATVKTRREQMAAIEDRRGLQFARSVVAGKLHNQANLLKYFAKYLAGTDAERFGRVRAAVASIEALLPRVGRSCDAGDLPEPVESSWQARVAGPVGLRPPSGPPVAARADGSPNRADEHHGADTVGSGAIQPRTGKSRAPARRPAPETVDASRGALLAVEGAAGRIYWAGVRELLGAELFAARHHRGAEDPVNAALNYGYGILYSKVWAALMVAGLEPFAGFLHVDRPGKPSLVLDVVEEYRQPVVDRTVIALFTRGTTVRMEEGRLDHAARKVVAGRTLERLETPVTYEGKSLPMRAVIQAQAHHLATALRGERRYRPYRFRW